ncbi:hypothetical protein [Kutzneria sp. NPDC052558]|uniref:hypothetical protein n=1 Tax=Kutzneria sp. NPDC052558 TaxID=3364121 RepID=UPI0037C98CB3
METNRQAAGRPDATAAAEALDSISDVRERIATRVVSPWWYHLGLGLSVLLVFGSIDLDRDFAPFGVIVGGVLLPTALVWAAKRATGVAIDRSAAPLGVRHVNGFYLIALVVLGGLGLWARLGLDLLGAMTAAGVVAAVLTVVIGLRTDRAWRAGVQAGR